MPEHMLANARLKLTTDFGKRLNSPRGTLEFREVRVPLGTSPRAERVIENVANVSLGVWRNDEPNT